MLDFGLSHLTSSHFILKPRSWVFKPTVPKVPYSPTHSQDYRACDIARLYFPTDFYPNK